MTIHAGSRGVERESRSFYEKLSLESTIVPVLVDMNRRLRSIPVSDLCATFKPRADGALTH